MYKSIAVIAIALLASANGFVMPTAPSKTSALRASKGNAAGSYFDALQQQTAKTAEEIQHKVEDAAADSKAKVGSKASSYLDNLKTEASHAVDDVKDAVDPKSKGKGIGGGYMSALAEDTSKKVDELKSAAADGIDEAKAATKKVGHYLDQQ